MQELRTRSSRHARTWHGAGQSLQDGQRVGARKLSRRFLPARGELLRLVNLRRTAEARAQLLRQRVVGKTKVGRLEALLQHRRSGEQRQRGPLSAVRRHQQYFSHALKHCAGDVSVHLAHQGHGAVADGDVQVLAQDGDLANLVHVFGIEGRIKKFAVERHRVCSRRRGWGGVRAWRRVCILRACNALPAEPGCYKDKQ